MKQILLLITALFSFSCIAQMQIGDDIDGDLENAGASLSMSANGTIVAVGGPVGSQAAETAGRVRVFENISNVWTQLGDDFLGTTAFEQFGTSLALSADGSILAIGTPRNDANGENAGQVLIYEFVGNEWIQKGNSLTGIANEEFGQSVALSADGFVLAVSAWRDIGNDNDNGRVRIYQFEGNTWSQIGATIEGEDAGDRLGTSVALSSNGTIVAIGSQYDSDGGPEAGNVRVFRNETDNWIQVGDNIIGDQSNGRFGGRLDLSADGSILASGAPLNNGIANGNNYGQVKVYQNNNDVWQQLGQSIYGEGVNDRSGSSIGLSADGSILAIGAFGNDNANGDTAGHVRIYRFENPSWMQKGSDIDGASEFDSFGRSLSLSDDGTIISIGGPNHDGGSGHVRVFDISDFLSVTDYSLQTVRVYPNPATDRLLIDVPPSIELFSTQLINLQGQLVHTFTSTTMNVSDLASGLYFLKIETSVGVEVCRILIE